MSTLSWHFGFVRTAFCALALGAVISGCDGGDPIPSEDLARSNGNGPLVRWNIGALPFPEIPLPNDVATRPDPTSPTGVRLNASFYADTAFERSLREQVNELDGWGTFMPISIAFEDDLDLQGILDRHQHDEYDFRDDVIYLVNLTTGVPVPLDIGNGNFPLTLSDPRGLFPNDPRAGGSNLLLSTVDEDTNHNGILELSEDTNFDGIMQRAAVFPASARPEDALTPFWEPEGPHGGTLILRPLVPLEQRTRYAVVVTDRLHGATGESVRSPFVTLAHPSQLTWLAAMQTHLANPDLANRFYGHLAWNSPTGAHTPSGRVAFAWTFETETTYSDLVDLRAGLHGQGRFAGLSAMEPLFTPMPAQGGDNCPPSSNQYIVPRAQLQSILQVFLPIIGFHGAQADALVASYDWVDYAYIAQFRSPYLAGNPASTVITDHWDLDSVANNPGGVMADNVQVWVFVPKRPAGMSGPFPVVFNAHGYSADAFQSLGFAGYFARFGFATVAMNAPTHGFPLGATERSLLSSYLESQCLSPFTDAILVGRSRDLNGDGILDSGGDFLSAEVFHTRDMVRQTALDYMQLIRALTEPAFSQPGPFDYNGDGHVDATGDLNGDGIVDIASSASGPAQPFYMWGESLGGIASMVLGAIEPALTAVSPVSGGAGLSDVGTRSTVDGVGGSVLGPLLGPAVIAVPASDRGPSGGHTRTACTGAQMSLRFVVSDVNRIGELEFACGTLDSFAGTMAPGDDVVVYDFANGQNRCARVQTDGRLFIPIAADTDDQLAVTIYHGAAVTDFASCTQVDGATVRTSIQQFSIGEGDCGESCGHVPPGAIAGSLAIARAHHHGDMLSSPGTGLGLRRQTASLRRFLQIAQLGLDPGDPINYAPLYSIRPVNQGAHPILSMTTIGDTDVPIATGNSFARAAGLLPFIHNATGSSLDAYVAPAEIWNRYQRTPDGVLIDNFVIEGIARLNRHPVAMGQDYLFDPDNLSDGMQPFGADTLNPPMRLVRTATGLPTSIALTDPNQAATQISTMWHPPTTGTALSSFINAYILPQGVHTFPPSDPSQQWDVGAYLGNLIARYFQSGATDVEFYTNPTGHQCLERSDCAFIPRTP